MNSKRTVKSWIENNIIIAASLLLIVTGAILIISFVVYTYIEAKHNGTIVFSNKYEQAKALKTIIERPDSFYFKLLVILGLIGLGLSFCFRLFQQKLNIFYLVEREFYKLKRLVTENRKILILSFGLFIVFYVLYVTLGIWKLPYRQLFHDDTFFGADVGKSITFDRGRYHYGVHPIRPLILVPFNFLLLFSHWVPEIVLSIILNSFFGAASTFLASLFFWNLTQKYRDTILLTILFSLSFAQLFFSVIPEYFALAACSIIPSYILFLLCLKYQKLYLGYWILAGLFSFGVTITDFGQTLIFFVATLFILKNKEKVVPTLEYIGIIFSLTFLLSILQKQIYYNAKYFFLPESSANYYEFIQTTIFNGTWFVFKKLITHFTLFNFVPPSPFQKWTTLLTFDNSRPDYNIFGFIALLFWLFFFLSGLYMNILSFKKESNRNYLLPVTCATLYNLALYSIFGVNQMFLYSCTYTFPILLLAINKSLMSKTYFTVALVLLLIFMGINNLLIMRQIILLT